MSERTVSVQFWLSPAEAKHLKDAVARSGLNRSAYLRLLIKGLVPTDIPPPDYFAMTAELNAIGNNLNQIAYKAHAFGVLDAERFDKEVTHLDEVLLEITRAVYRHREVTNWPSLQSGTSKAGSDKSSST
jgi:hypothetical protein